MAGEQRIKVTLRWEFGDPNYLKVNSAMRDRAWRESHFYPSLLLSLHCEFISLTAASLTRRQDFCTSVTSRVQTSTTCFFGIANTAAKTSHPPFSHVQPLPHAFTRTLLNRSTPGTLCLISCSQGKQSYSFVKLIYSYNIIRAWQRLPSSTVPCLTSIQLMPHQSSLGDFVLFISQVSSNLPRSLPCKRL